MKANLLLQFALCVALAFLSAIMMVVAFMKDSVVMWKIFSIGFFLISILLAKQIHKELRQ
jgi:hypothetical protein